MTNVHAHSEGRHCTTRRCYSRGLAARTTSTARSRASPCISPRASASPEQTGAEETVPLPIASPRSPAASPVHESPIDSKRDAVKVLVSELASDAKPNRVKPALLQKWALVEPPGNSAHQAEIAMTAAQVKKKEQKRIAAAKTAAKARSQAIDAAFMAAKVQDRLLQPHT